MRMQEFWAGALFAVIGTSAVIGAQSYEVGTLTRMGPGYFPTLLGLVLLALGTVAMIGAVRSREAAPIGKWPFVPLAFLVAGIISFGVLIVKVGLVPALIALITLSCYSRWKSAPLEVAAICVVVIALSIGLFIVGLQLPIAIW